MSQIKFEYDVPVWHIYGMDFSFDAEDPDVWEKYEHASKELQKKVKGVPKTGGASKLLKYEMNCIREFLEEIFGKEDTDKLFEKVPNRRRTYYAVHNSFIEFAIRCREASNEWIEEFNGDMRDEPTSRKPS